MPIKTIGFLVAYGAISGAKALMDKVLITAVTEIVKAKLGTD